MHIYITLRCFYHVFVSPDFIIDNKDYVRTVGVITFPRNVLFGDVRKHLKCKNTAEQKIIHKFSRKSMSSTLTNKLRLF